MHKHFDVLTTSSLFLSVRMKFPHNPRIFTSCFAFNSLAFSTERRKKNLSENQLHLQMLREEIHSFKMQFPLDPFSWF